VQPTERGKEDRESESWDLPTWGYSAKHEEQQGRENSLPSLLLPERRKTEKEKREEKRVFVTTRRRKLERVHFLFLWASRDREERSKEKEFQLAGIQRRNRKNWRKKKKSEAWRLNVKCLSIYRSLDGQD
jgi:hypothetical protein